MPAREHLRAALSRLQHRGPDAEGLYRADGVFLGHRRLSIVDLDERANQPLRQGRHHIVFNGEIYNYRALRKDLEACGHRFCTTSDTEVLLAGYREYGKDVLDRLEGMFAFAVWEEDSRRLFLARDRFGEKPLFYYLDHEMFLFGSEIQSLIRLVPAARLRENSQGLGLYFLYTYIPSPHAPYENMGQLRPGEWMAFDVDKWSCRQHRYYELTRHVKPADFVSYRDAVAGLRQQLQESVQLRMNTSDVPVATFLSGGIDSSIITVLASRVAKAPFNAYSISFPEDPGFDESSFAREVTQALGNVGHRVIPATESRLLDFADGVIARLGEPFADASFVPTAYLCSQVEEKVILGGDGADEVFAGYGVYPAVVTSARLPSWIKHVVCRAAPKNNPHGIENPLLRRWSLLCRHMRGTALEDYRSWREYASVDMLESLGVDLSLAGAMNHELDRVRSGRLMDIQAVDIMFNLPNDMLKKVDYASMLYGLEVRLPYLDRGVVESGLGLPDHYKIHRNRRKRILRDAFREQLPRSILTRPKKGFLLPIRSWFKAGRIRERLMEMMSGQNIFDRGDVHRLMEEHRAGTEDHSVFLWTLYAYLSWRQSVLPGS